jgi:hypothetical protein
MANEVTDVLGYQLSQPGTPIGDNCRKANLAESHGDFVQSQLRNPQFPR